MADNLGKASLELSVDLEKFSNELKFALTMVKNTLLEMKQGLNVNTDNVNLGPVKDSLKGVSDAAKETVKSVTGIEEAGNKALTGFAKFELVKGVIDQVSGAFRELKSYVLDLGKEYADAELVQGKLEAGLKRIGSGDYYERLIKQADELHKITPFDDQDITNMQAMMTTFDGVSGELIERLTPAMLNLSSAFARAGDTGMNLQQIAIMIGKNSASEIAGALQRVGIVMTELQKQMWETMTPAQRFAEMEKILAQNSNLTAEAFGQTLAGQIKIAENAFGDIKEAIGKAFAPLIIEVSKAVQGLAEWFGSLSETAKGVIGVIGLVGIALASLTPILTGLNIASGGTILIIGAAVAAIAGMAIYISDNIESIKAWVTEIAGGQESIDNFKTVISELWSGLQDLGDYIYNELVSVFNEVKDNVSEVIKAFTDNADSSLNLTDVLKNLAKEGFDALKNIIHSTIDAYKNISNAVTDFIVKNPELVAALKWLAEAGFGTAIWEANALISVFSSLISWASKVATALKYVVDALLGLTDLTAGGLVDAIINPEKFKARMESTIDSVRKLGDVFKENIQVSATEPSLTYDKPIGPSPLKDTKNTGTSGTGKQKKDKEQETEFEKLTALYDHRVKVMEQEVATGEKTIQQQKELYEEYKNALEAIEERLTKTDEQNKAEEKISELKKKQYDIDKKITEQEQEAQKVKNQMIADVDNFIEKRRIKVVAGIDKELGEIELAYKQKEEDITKKQVSEVDKRIEYEKLQAAKQREIEIVRLNSEKSVQTEINDMKMRLEGSEYKQALVNLDKKYEAEKKKIYENYKGASNLDELLKLKELEHIKEVQNVHTAGYTALATSIQASFQSLTSEISTSFTTMWTNVFGEATSIFQKFFQYVVNKLVELAASKLFTSIFDLVTGGGFSIFGTILGGIFGDSISGISKTLNEAATYNNDQMAGIFRSIGRVGSTASNVIRGTAINNPFVLPTFNAPTGSGERTINVHIDGTKVEVKKLTGLQEGDWTGIVDEMMPHISSGLKRIGKSQLDNNIK